MEILGGMAFSAPRASGRRYDSSVQTDSVAKLLKAEEFLTVADTALSCEYFDAAVSLAVSAAINGSDVICQEVLGRYSAGKSHDGALSLLRKCGTPGTTVSRHLQKVLNLKSKAQYSPARCRYKEAEDVFKHAQRLIEFVKLWVKQREQ
ncbi:HEPN domain-containing protein [Streptomyces sp. NPDC087300]|uniref:HEPN domain-containing protein n=1 Tax=Streptomyces sp. NPDC087300 TaxID=3365780 RepID=UPI00380B3314